MKLIALLFAVVVFFSFALENAVKDITYPPSTTVVSAEQAVPTQQAAVSQKVIKPEQIKKQVPLS